MGVRLVVPNVWSFSIALYLRDRIVSVIVEMDMNECTVTVPLWILHEVFDQRSSFVEQLSKIASYQYAFLKWDGMSDLLTEYCPIKVFPGFHRDKESVNFSFEVGEYDSVSIETLDIHTRIEIR